MLNPASVVTGPAPHTENRYQGLQVSAMLALANTSPATPSSKALTPSNTTIATSSDDGVNMAGFFGIASSMPLSSAISPFQTGRMNLPTLYRLTLTGAEPSEESFPSPSVRRSLVRPPTLARRLSSDQGRETPQRFEVADQPGPEVEVPADATLASSAPPR